MSKHNLSTLVVCPFFKWYDRSIISCEGVEADSSVHLAFATPMKRRTYMEKMCQCSYPECRLAQMLEGKYD